MVDIQDIDIESLGGDDGGCWGRWCARLLKKNKELQAENKRLKEALEAWQLYDSESFDKHPCPDNTLRMQYRTNARKITEQALKEGD